MRRRVIEVQHRSGSPEHGRRGRPSSSAAAAQRKVQRQRTPARRARSRRNPGSGEGASSGERREPRRRRARTGDPRAGREQEGRPNMLGRPSCRGGFLHSQRRVGAITAHSGSAGSDMSSRSKEYASENELSTRLGHSQRSSCCKKTSRVAPYH